MAAKKLAIYDMDRTITVTATYPPFLRYAVPRLSAWRVLFVMALPVLFAGYALKLLGRARLKEWLQALFIGHHTDAVALDAVAGAFARRTLAENMFDKARARIAEDRALGYEIVLCSASFDFYVRRIAALLDIPDGNVLATKLYRDGTGHISARIDGANCYGPEKLRRVDAWLAARGLARSDCHVRAYSDHESDAPLLDFADEPFAATPTPRMLRLAQAKGWPVLDFCEASEDSL